MITLEIIFAAGMGYKDVLFKQEYDNINLMVIPPIGSKVETPYSSKCTVKEISYLYTHPETTIIVTVEQ